ncbi:MAG TPA: hypothetical protein VMV51_10735 [Gemmatimonadaceae bacterium]|nr:hypothetical protein [Gemmatimonadaceae bacterium]
MERTAINLQDKFGRFTEHRQPRVIAELNDDQPLHHGANLVFLAIVAALIQRFLKTGGPAMLRMMQIPTP